MLTEDGVMTNLQVSKLFVVFLAMAVVGASCGSDPEVKEPSPPPATALAVAEETAKPDTLEESEDGSTDDWFFDPDNWDEVPDWWVEVQDVPFHLLIDQRSQTVETPPSDLQASELHLGDRVLVWRIPADWEETCISHSCTYGPEWGSPGTNGFVVGWGGDKLRSCCRDPSSNGTVLGEADPLRYLAGETQPFECEADEDRSDPEAIDLYPEPWFVACVGTIDEFTVARVETFRLDETCEPYGNSYGAWIGWEHAHQHNIDDFVRTLAIQMLADRIECVTPETLLAQNFAHWWQEKGKDWPAQAWVTELQRRIGAETDGIYGPQTRDLHVQAVKDQTPMPSLPFISAGPCGIFKLDISKWPSEDLISQLDDNDKWVPVASSLVSPLSDREPWWYSGLGEKHEEPVAPPMPWMVDTIDATGDGVDDFILRFSGGNDSVAFVATIHQNASGCSWRYVDGYPVRLAAVSHDYWDVGGKLGVDSQGNSCDMNMAYARYNSEGDSYERTMCAVYPPWDWGD